MEESMIEAAKTALNEERRKAKLKRIGVILQEIESHEYAISELKAKLEAFDKMPLCKFGNR